MIFGRMNSICARRYGIQASTSSRSGSLFLGGMVVALAFGLRRPLLLVFIGIVYVVETLSDIIQIGSVKLTGKRVFKMAPIHHHFEMSGWSEVKIVAVFSAVTAVGCLIAVLLVL